MTSQVKLFVEDDQEIRRFNLDASATFSTLYQRVKDITGKDAFRMFWKDSEDDMVVLGSDDELQAARQMSPKDLLRVYVKAAKKAPVDDKKIHKMVTCDGCEGQVAGTRYKCMECPDYDLCEECEAKGKHSEHDMMAIRTPRQHGHPGRFVGLPGFQPGFGGAQGPCGGMGGRRRMGNLGMGCHGPRQGSFHRRGGPTGPGMPPPPYGAPFMGDQTVEMDIDVNRPVGEIIAQVSQRVMEALKINNGEAEVQKEKEAETGQATTTTQEDNVAEHVVVASTTAVADAVNVVAEAVQNFVADLNKNEIKIEIKAENKAESDGEWTHLEAEAPADGEIFEMKTEKSSDTVSVAGSTASETEAKNARIESALKAMEEMGFTNEGNLLRRLLENYNGDVARVLDSIK
ncbi:hypothetical protein RvY_00608 [Ramazzottius varieornatus]|uniref:ZZ-type domain-containing protein n=1 Tax=Ramazzottius varieornatus TaxID=947166 RepID=A0A1D1UH17_RAMVA|nr:hypothetical protein RvY_00608 [Ramazzottius varieornatus]